MTIQLARATVIAGSVAAAGSQHTLDAATEAHLIYQGIATRVGTDPDYSGPQPAFVNAAGNALVVDGNEVPIGGTPCEAFGASPSATAAVNTAAIQAAQNMAGAITLETDGEFLVNRAILLDDLATIKLGPRTVIKRDANVYMPVLMNRYCAHLCVANIFHRASGVVTVAQNNHPYSVGQVIFISSGPDASFRGLITVSAASANSWSYVSTGSDGYAGTNAQFYNVFPVREQLAGTTFVRTSNYVTVTQAGHDKYPGLEVYLGTAGASTDFAPGVVEIVKITDTTWTYRAAGADGTATGTIITNYNYGITIEGGRIEGNRLNQAAQTGMETLSGNTVLFGLVTGLQINSAITGGTLRAMTAFNCADVTLGSHASVDDCLVGWQFEGGLRGIVVDNHLVGSAQYYEANPQKQDDYLAFTGTAYAAGAPGNYDSVISPYGLTYFSGIDMRRLNIGNALNAIKITAMSTCPFKGVTRIGSIQGRLFDNDPELAIGGSIRIMDDGPGLVGTTIDTLIINDMCWTSPDSVTGDLQINGTGTIKRLVLRDTVHEIGVAASPSASVNMQGMTIDDLVVEHNNIIPYDSTGKVVFQFLGGTVRKWTLKNCLITTDNARTIAVVSGGTVNTIELLNNLYAGLTADGGKLLDIATVGVSRIVIRGAHPNASLPYKLGSLISLGNVAHQIDIDVDDFDLVTVSGLVTTPNGSTGAVVNIYAGQVKWSATGGNKFLQVGTGTWNLFAGNGLRIPNEKLALFGFGSPVYRFDVKGSGVKVNLNDAATYGSAAVVPSDGDELHNSTAGVVAAGRTVRRAGAWTAL